jgi:hypothetical protein
MPTSTTTTGRRVVGIPGRERDARHGRRPARNTLRERSSVLKPPCMWRNVADLHSSTAHGAEWVSAVLWFPNVVPVFENDIIIPRASAQTSPAMQILNHGTSLPATLR